MNCRDDYVKAVKLWKDYGFTPRHTKPSRGKSDHVITTWVYDLNNHDLFSFSESTGIKVLLDMNIIVDLREGKNDEYEIQTLTADWLINDVSYHCSSESFIEAQNDSNIQRRNMTRKFLRGFDEAKIKDEEAFNCLCDDLLEVLPKTGKNDLSDKKQLASAIHNSLEYFVTRDGDLLDVAEKVYELHGVQVYDPVQFICKIDQLLHSTNYHPSRLAGADFTIQQCQSEDIDEVVGEFLKRDKSESKSRFKNTVSLLISQPRKSELKIVKEPTGKMVGLYGWFIEEDKINIEILRTTKSSLSITLFKQLITNLIIKSRINNLTQICLNENHLSLEEKEVLREFYFKNHDECWMKITPTGVCDLQNIDRKLKPFKDYPFAAEVIESIPKISKSSSARLEVERLFYPLKVKNDQLKTFIIPIRPTWSAQLFDHIDAQSRIFSVEPEIAWNRENIYYRSATHQNTITSPARILWYVSDDQLSFRSKQIVGCSYLDFVEIDEAKSLFKTYKNLGVYKWKDIYKLTKKDAYKKIMGIRFSETELFHSPISLSKAQNILKRATEKSYTFQSPVKINEELFLEFYKLGFNLK